jgi:drug/metabolite transporter (DMT)-like permease
VWKGDALMFAAAIVGAIYNVLAITSLRKYPAIAIATVQMVAGVSALFVATAIGTDLSGIIELPTKAWVAVVYLMSVGGVVSFYLWTWALERIAASAVAITITINPFAAMSLAALILGEPITVHVLIGLVAVAAGIAIVNWPKRPTTPMIAPGPSAGP